ncbi:hypothetical protein NA78x_003442 [Anatilimnocola sp. NA78]|uniref:hypothetical protein n=1 Tax=Anatilimnocola sp. NA78 TaxID=3415683 RepID=UPI003CE552C2
MTNWLKALLATAVSFGPTAVKEYVHRYLGDQWTDIALISLASAVLVGTWKFLQADERFLKVRDPNLKHYLKQNLRQAEEAKLHIRGHVFIPWGIWPFIWLVPAFSYGANTSDPDYGKSWYWRHGLVWQVFRNKIFAIYLKSPSPAATYVMSEADKKQTEHVLAALCLPICKIPGSGRNVEGRIVAILALDADCPGGVEFLNQHYKALFQRKNKELVDLVDAVSLYF